MKIEITSEEKMMLALSISTQMAALKRAINTEKEIQIKNIRQAAYDKYQGLLMVIMSTGENNNETTISKQK